MKALNPTEKAVVSDSIRECLNKSLGGDAKISDEGVAYVYEHGSAYITRVKLDMPRLGIRIVEEFFDNGNTIPDEFITRSVSVPVPTVPVDGAEPDANTEGALAPLLDYIQARIQTPAVDTEGMRAEIRSAIDGLDANVSEKIERVMSVLRQEIEEAKKDSVKTIEIKTEREVRKIEGYTHPEFETVLAYLTARIPVFMHGPAGTGKSHMAEQLAEALGLKYCPANSLQTKYDLIGYNDAYGQYVQTTFYDAFVNGGLFFVDEFDNGQPDATVCLNTALANGYCEFPCGVKQAHPDFVCLCAGNTVGKGADNMYCGRSQLDSATLDRFAFVEIDYDKRVESQLANGDSELLAFIRAFRKACSKNGVMAVVSYRAISKVVAVYEKLPLSKVIKECILAGMDKADIQTVYADLPDSKYREAMRSLL